MSGTTIDSPPNAPSTRRFRRSLAANAAAGRCEAGLEDDFHSFRIELEHDGERVTSLRSAPLRIPRSVCAEAAGPLRAFVGQRLDAVSVPIDPLANCTHLFDLARFAMAQSHRGGARRYDLDVPYPAGNRSRVRLHRDGELLLDWDLVDRIIVSPGPFKGLDFRGRAAWPTGLDAQLMEAAKILRRGVWLGWERSKTARVFGPAEVAELKKQSVLRLSGNCYAWQPVNIGRGESFHGKHIRDFSASPETVLADFIHPAGA